ncbi:hypothetical protein WJX84_006619 [Apatococcus fuscideae]|uniref:Histone-binding protein RBBP4-like N-terminal domain-containing protein n=1 Tax=Apatococcus fuscideae TaxID=2026836 RepID=A0AAW1TM32_9CHLO
MRHPKKGKSKGKSRSNQAEQGDTVQLPAAATPAARAVWRPDTDAVGEGEELQHDPTAYECLHSFGLEWPCLSYDFLHDDLGGSRSHFPHTIYAVTGSQAATAKANVITLFKLADIAGKRPSQHDSSSSDDDMSDEEEGQPCLSVRQIAHHGAINRIRSMPQQPSILATWSEAGHVQVWDLAAQLQQLRPDEPGTAKPGRSAPLQLQPQSTEGYALDWSTIAQGHLASGDCHGNLHAWQPVPAGKWQVSSSYAGHQGSVEDIQWSPSEATVFASCSADQHICIWDTREQTKPMLRVHAHPSDVNVISWNPLTSYMLASGAEDGGLRAWDLRELAAGEHVANFTYHRKPVTSLEWSPSENSVMAACSADNQLSVWDLALERDPEEEAAMAMAPETDAPSDLPPQLLFVHAGQDNPKELHWHPQIPGMLASTAADGFNVFKPANV